MTLMQLWSILRGRRTNFRCLNISWTYDPDGDPMTPNKPKERDIVTIYVPDGYADADDFLRDCQFERSDATEIRTLQMQIEELEAINDALIEAMGGAPVDAAGQGALK